MKMLHPFCAASITHTDSIGLKQTTCQFDLVQTWFFIYLFFLNWDQFYDAPLAPFNIQDSKQYFSWSLSMQRLNKYWVPAVAMAEIYLCVFIEYWILILMQWQGCHVFNDSLILCVRYLKV